jgi:hypothetical protein
MIFESLYNTIMNYFKHLFIYTAIRCQDMSLDIKSMSKVFQRL